jgi:hypothetical protein
MLLIQYGRGRQRSSRAVEPIINILNILRDLGRIKRMCIVFVLGAATAVALPAQVFTNLDQPQW